MSQPKERIRILGVDPGSRHLGWGVVDVQGRDVTFVACGVISPKAKASLPERLHQIHQGLAKVIEEQRPQEAAVEGLFHAKNAKSALLLGHAQGVALLALAEEGLEVGEYPPREVKKAVTGSGNADKVQVAKLVEMQLGPTGALRADATDALAVALCHAAVFETQRRLAGAG